MTVTTNTQVSFNGLDLFGDAYEVQAVEGIAGMPQVRTSDIIIAGRDGQRGGTDRLDTRVVTLTVAIYAFTDEDFYAAVNALRDAFVPSTTTDKVLTFRFGGVADDGVRRLNCRCRGLSIPMERSYWMDVATATIQLVATDPLIYDDTLQDETTTLPTAGGGLEFDATFDLIFGDVAEGGAIYANNEGNWPADLLIRIDGPATNPRVENVTTGETLEMDFTLEAGDYLVFDTAERTVLLNGTASRYSYLTNDSSWFRLQPGSNEISFRATTSSAATLTVAWRSAWL